MECFNVDIKMCLIVGKENNKLEYKRVRDLQEEDKKMVDGER